MPKQIMGQIETPADALRRRISEAEALVVSLKGAGPRALTLLKWLDEIERLSGELAGVGFDLRAEEGRIEAIHAGLRAKKGLLLRELRRQGGMASLREARAPTLDCWWWFLDQELAAERRRTRRRYGRIAAIAAVLLVIVGYLAWRFLRPDPLTQALYRNQSTAVNLIGSGRLAEAIPYLEQNVALAPSDPEWPIRLGVLLKLAGDSTRSENSFARGRVASIGETEFLLQRGEAYIEAGASELALADVQRAAELRPTSPLAAYLMGRAYTGMGRQQEALAAYERATQLAGKGDETIFVMAKVEMSGLLQSPEIRLPSATP